MKPELLESLLTDRAVGELAPGVAALLDDYLGGHPDAARLAAEWTASADLARRAVALPQTAPRRALDLSRLRRRVEFIRFPSRVGSLSWMAAGVALGLGIAWMAKPPRPPLVAEAAPAARAPAGQFWSLAAWSGHPLERPAASIWGQRQPRREGDQAPTRSTAE
jgi:anti-sigma factor RsiW